jgi:hypothetical protein
VAAKLTANKIRKMGTSQLSRMLASLESDVSTDPNNIRAKRAVNLLDNELRQRKKGADPLTFGKL